MKTSLIPLFHPPVTTSPTFTTVKITVYQLSEIGIVALESIWDQLTTTSTHQQYRQYSNNNKEMTMACLSSHGLAHQECPTTNGRIAEFHRSTSGTTAIGTQIVCYFSSMDTHFAIHKA
jgi:hypothetical protein